MPGSNHTKHPGTSRSRQSKDIGSTRGMHGRSYRRRIGSASRAGWWRPCQIGVRVATTGLSAGWAFTASDRAKLGQASRSRWHDATGTGCRSPCIHQLTCPTGGRRSYRGIWKGAASRRPKTAARRCLGHCGKPLAMQQRECAGRSPAARQVVGGRRVGGSHGGPESWGCRVKLGFVSARRGCCMCRR